ncbi:MAG: response regulator [Candidatus Moranbacteria bacterium]|nr:response regulator [Candidatus Moranbacteria bacterium]
MKKILFAEDDPVVRVVTSQMLERLGYEVTSSEDGDAALSVFLCDPHRFDLVLTDQNMPRLSGIELADRITKANPGIPVILYSGFDLQREIPRSIDGFIMKPFTQKDLGELLGRIVASKTMR